MVILMVVVVVVVVVPPMIFVLAYLRDGNLRLKKGETIFGMRFLLDDSVISLSQLPSPRSQRFRSRIIEISRVSGFPTIFDKIIRKIIRVVA